MKLVLVFVCLLLASCAHENTSPSIQSQLLGKWQVQSDQLNFGGDIHQYSSASSDYYDFHSNGALYIHEATQTDTASYIISTDSTVTITFVKGVVVEFQTAGGVVTNDNITNRFNQTAKLKFLSANQLQFSSSFNYNVSTPVLAGATATAPIPVTINTSLKR